MMVAFRCLFGVSVGALISLSFGETVVAQDGSSVADSDAGTEFSFNGSTVEGELFELTSVSQNFPVSGMATGSELRFLIEAENLEILQSQIPAIEEDNQEADSPMEIEPPDNQNRLLEGNQEPLEPIEDTEQLNPSPNPLQLPTRVEEVTVGELVPITLEQAIKLARENNQDLRDARLNLNQAQEQLAEALGAEFPTLSLQTDLQRSTSATSEIRGANTNVSFTSPDGVTTDLSTTLQLNYNLYTGGQRPAQIRLAEAQVRTQELVVEQTAEQLRFDVTDAYYSVQEADSQVAISRAAVEDAAQSLRDAQLLEQAGLGTRFDVLQAEVDLANEEQNLTRAISQQRISRRQLVEILGIGQKIEVTAATPPEVAGTWDLSLEDSIILAYQNRAELEQQLEQKTIAQENQIISLAAIKPQVSLFTNYNVRNIIDDGGGSGTGTGDGLSLGAQVQWTIFDGGQARARARQAQENEAIAENNFEQIRNQIRTQVEQAFYNLQANEQNINTAEIAVDQAEESLRLARLRFQAGVGTQTDVINAQTALTQARGNLLTAIIDYNRSLASLQRAVSNLPDNRLFDTP